MSDRSHDEDRWLQEAGRLAREEVETEDLRRFDRRWDAYAGATLSPPEQEALLAEAEASAEGRQAAELFRPLGDDFKRDLVRQALAEARGGEKPAQRSAGVRSGWLHRLLGGGAPWSFRLAVAAATVVAAVAGFQLLRPPLPSFELDVEGTSGQRSAGPPETAVPDPGLGLRIRLRGATATKRRPTFRVYVRREGRVERWTAAEEKAVTSADGTVLVEAPAWSFGPGRWTLSIVLGHRGALPSEEELRGLWSRGAPPPSAARWQLLEQELLVD